MHPRRPLGVGEILHASQKVLVHVPSILTRLVTRLWSQTGRGWDWAARTTNVPQIGIEPPDAPRERYVTAYHGRASGHRPRTNDMEPRIHVITLAVRDLDRALAFYRDGLGLESAGVVGTEFTGDDDTPAGAIALFRLEGELILSLYPRTELAKDADVPFGPPKSGEFSIGHLVATREDVDELLAQAEAAGATRTAPAHDRPWGIYSGYFRDLDGHLWEIIWNPR